MISIMRKMKLLLALFALFMGTTASWAQGWTSSEVGAGEFYLLNVGGNGFLVGANDWGTRASIDATGGIPVTLAGSGATYTISTSPTYDGKYLGVDGFVDQGSADWVFEAVEGESNVYKMKCGNNYLYADAVADAGVSAKTTTLGTDPGTNMAYWKLISKDNLFADFEGASETSPVWATCLIKNPGFGRRINKDDENAGKGWGWTVDASNKNMSGGQDKNRCAEHWQSAFTVKQIITDLPNGKYGLRIQAAITEYNVTGADIAVAYIKSGSNESTAPFNSMIHGENNMDKLSDNFSNGEYFTNYMVVTVTNGQIEIGVRGTRTDTWCVYDNFQLSYLGEDLAAYVEAYHNALDAAKAVNQSARMSATILSALQTAISNYGSVSETDKNALLAAANALNTATANANTSIASYAIIASGTVSTSSLDGWTCTNNNTFHINTWSVEGNSDGSNMTTPFIENWVGAGSKDNPNYLGAGTFSYTLEGLEPGEVYYAQALIRSYSELGNTPNGPNFFINDVETNLSTEGTECTSGNAKGRYATMGAAATVGPDGKITLGAVIAADANYNWVAFKNVSIQSMDDAFNAAVEKVKDLEGKVPTSVYNRAYAVVTEYTTNKPTTAEGYETAIAAIEAAATAASAYVEPYAAWTAAKNKAETNYASVTLVTTVKEAQTTVVEAATDVSEVTNATTELNNAIASYDKWMALKASADVLVAVANDNATANGILETAISEQETAAEAATTKSDLEAAISTLKDAMGTYVGDANPVGDGAQFDCTFMLTNPDLSVFKANGPQDGWYTDQTFNSQNSQVMQNNNSVANTADNTKFAMYEYWSDASCATSGYTVYTKLDLPVGTYKMEALCMTGWGYHASEPDGLRNITFSAGETDGTSITTSTLEPANIEFVQTSASEVKIGLKAHEGNTCNWMGIGYVQLFKVQPKTFTISEDADYDTTQEGAGAVTLTRTIKENTWNTIWLPFSMTEDDLKKAFGNDVEIAEYSETPDGDNSTYSTVTFKKMDNPAISPLKPVLLRTSTAGTTYTIPARTVVAGTPAVSGTNFDFVGTYEDSKEIEEGDYFINSDKLWKSKGSTTIKGTRAYIKKKVAGARIAEFSIGEGETTGISTIATQKADNAAYDMQGRRVETLKKGVYVVNGKKVVVK